MGGSNHCYILGSSREHRCSHSMHYCPPPPNSFPFVFKNARKLINQTPNSLLKFIFLALTLLKIYSKKKYIQQFLYDCYRQHILSFSLQPFRRLVLTSYARCSSNGKDFFKSNGLITWWHKNRRKAIFNWAAKGLFFLRGGGGYHWHSGWDRIESHVRLKHKLIQNIVPFWKTFVTKKKRSIIFKWGLYNYF